MADLHASWRRAWEGVGCGGDGANVRDAVLAAYAEPHRSYHTLQHLHECIDRLAACSDLAVHAAEVELALWFHDAVHDVERADNERRSADAAREAVAAAGAPAAAADRIASLVLATQHGTVVASNGDEALLVDIDLAILGAAPERFAEYEAQIRREYAHVPGPLFRARRRAVLAAFLARDRIYATARLRAELEQRARANLSLAIGADVA